MIMKYKKAKVITIIIAVLVIVGVFVACGTNRKQSIEDIDNINNYKIDVDSIYKFRNPYIGDASKTGGIVSNLLYPQGTSVTGMELQTTEQPYGLTIWVDGSRKDFVDENDEYIYSAYIAFSLIENLGEISFLLKDDEGNPKISILRSDLVQSYDMDFYKLSETKEDFIDFIEELENKYDKGTLNNFNNLEKITLEKIVELSKKGEDLTWSDFENYEFTKQPLFTIETDDKVEQMVYDTLSMYDALYSDTKLRIHAPIIFDSFEHEDEFKILLLDYELWFELIEDRLIEVGGSNIPMAIIYTIESDGSYTFKETIEAMDGSFYFSSIEEFSYPKTELARDIGDTQKHIEEQQALMLENIKLYNETNNLGIKYLENENTGEKIIIE